jgi:hypothetical protein
LTRSSGRSTKIPMCPFGGVPNRMFHGDARDEINGIITSGVESGAAETNRPRRALLLAISVECPL